MNRLIASHVVRSLTSRPEALASSSSRVGISVRQSPRRGPYNDAVPIPIIPVAARRGLSSASSDAPSHDDFSPRKKVDTSNDSEKEIRDLIDSHVKSNRVMLYMKGSPSQPMCGFSATVVSILKKSGVDFSSVNVLDYPEVREGVKKYSQWPTIPQLYVDGEFVGGCDIVRDMDDSGELTDLLKPGGKDDAKEGMKE
jgi:monothiol glutaredoxin